MKEKDTRPANIQSKETVRPQNQIGSILNISVITEYENGDVYLILDNRDEKAISITISYAESDKSIAKPLEHFELSGDSQRKVSLPKGFEKWEELKFDVREENPIREKNRQIPNTSLKKLSDEAKRQTKGDPPQPKTEPSISKSEQTDNPINIIGKDLKPDIETINPPERRSTDYQRKAETTVQETREQITELECTYKDGGPIDFINIQDPTPGQKALMILNWIARAIEDWVNELEQSRTANPDLIQTLEFANQDIKDKLKEIRGPKSPSPESLDPDTDVSTDAAYNEFKNECLVYVSRYEGMLSNYQLERKITEIEYNQFIPKFIKDRLFNGVARFINFEQLPEQVDKFLQIVDCEVVPIEIGETKADARLHDIQASQRIGVDPGTIVEVVLPGLRRKADGEIVQKPVVIRGE